MAPDQGWVLADPAMFFSIKNNGAMKQFILKNLFWNSSNLKPPNSDYSDVAYTLQHMLKCAH